ncbi:HAMP domain-containing sensor histidine kinase [Bacillus sp. SM2101]|uniref:sensor histidine kinase n=1 Tax=Bacillus sp. SM2101 TaxID=2805366 RepID=UPI001BDE02A4|nr:HAMP domain-containing sensor histidine kinase [Bacillus sp. SM2101]
MKNWPLSIQISIVFAGLIIFIGVTLVTFIPNTLNSFFTNEIFTTIENSQLQMTNDYTPSENSLEQQQSEQNARSVNHVVLDFKGNIVENAILPKQTLANMYINARRQKEGTARYETLVQGQTIYYTISKIQILRQPRVVEQGFIISFMWDSYRKELVHTLFSRLVQLMLFVLIGGLLLAFLFAKWVSKPIVQMKEHVHHIANRQWDEPMVVERRDEIGVLSQSIEKMRVQLKEQDTAQQTMLQHVSHDLKTPVMVIRSFAQAIRDGIYPNGTIEQTAETIENESKRLETKIKDLLYLTKLNYLAQQQTMDETFNVKEIIEEVYSQFQLQRSDIQFELSLLSITITGDREQWRIAFENIIDNALRYVNNIIKITMNREYGQIIISIWNDGPTIPDDEIEDLFKPYTKGKQGNFGLGLTIVKRIVDIHNAEITVFNRNHGVEFLFRIPLSKNE